MATGRTVAILSPGEMGTAFGRALQAGGHRVVTSLEGRSDVTRRRCEAAGFEVRASLDDIAREAELIVAIVPSLSALPLARRAGESIARSGSRPMYLDANSIGPHTARAIGAAIETAGGIFVDGSIIGAASELRERATVYLSGEHAADVAEILEPALETAVLGDEVGQASAFKVLYAGLTKGLSAIGIELLSGAAKLGLREPLLEKYRTSQPGIYRFFEHTLPGLPPRAARRSEEMVELSDTLEPLGLSANMAHGAEATLARLAERYRTRGGPEAETLEALVDWLAARD
ncbi:MAG TPA: DUF1932 domain-containing protein [Chloroflexota bacterium]|nr:DUF1932 domain-containing protein [Chloroflexota bacterium]